MHGSIIKFQRYFSTIFVLSYCSRKQCNCIINKSVIDTCLLLTTDLLLTSEDFVFTPTYSPRRSKIFLLRELDVSSLDDITDFTDDVFESIFVITKVMFMEIMHYSLDSAFITVLLIDAACFSERFDGNSNFIELIKLIITSFNLFLTISLL